MLLAGCAEAKLAIFAGKQVARADGSAPNGVKIGKPYQVKGVWYYPASQPGYDETGIASWYGGKFHGRKTANGETYDMNTLTAAHKTLPLPSLVQVTNLENGRSLELRVNDRGPFVNGRIIDVSRRAAQLLGFERNGTAKVRVNVIGGDAPAGATIMAKPVTTPAERDALPAVKQAGVGSESLPPPPGGRVANPAQSDDDKPAALVADAAPRQAEPTTTTGNVGLVPQPSGQVRQLPVKRAPNIFIQAGSFTRFDNANRLRARLASLGPTEVANVRVAQQDFFRVLIGPLASVDQADQALDKVLATGITDARIIVD
ncbi:MAG: septal ring lytic transglycosylase RlpA family protein [Alphaproteobacteria bacterium]